MKKKFILILLLSFGNLLHAESVPNSPIIEFRTSYYYPTSSNFRELFHEGIDYQLTGTLPLFCGENQCWSNGINLWGAVDYYYKSERTHILDEKYSIRIVPVTVGIKYFFPTLNLPLCPNFYAAAGMKYYFAHVHNDSDLVKRSIDRHGLGGVVEVGFISRFCDSLILDAFVSYSFKTFSAHSSSNPAVQGTSLNLKTINIGGGIGYIF